MQSDNPLIAALSDPLPLTQHVLLFDAEFNLLADECNAAYQLTLSASHRAFEMNAEWRVLARTEPYNKGHFQITMPEPVRRGWATLPREDVAALIKQLVQQPAHPCAFALKWAGSDWDERQKIVIRCRQGSLEELEQILRCLTYEWAPRSTHWREAHWKIEVDVASDENLTTKHFETPLRNYELNFDDADVTFTADQMGWLQVINRHFLPCYDAKLTRNQINVQMWARSQGIFWTIDISAPSQHECLEARLQLRDWLHDKVTLEEIHVLLGETE